jgi:glycosyltransferase involved in cell wall biosynthesis
MTSVHAHLDARIFHKQCKSLVREGYDVTLIAPGADRKVQDGVRLESIPSWSNPWLRMIRGPIEVYRRARRQNANVYHFHDPELIPIALLLRATGKKVIYDIHEDLPKTVSYKAYIPKCLRGIVAAVADLLERGAARWFSALIAATPSIAARFSRVNRRVVVVHNYPRMEEIRLCLSPDSDEAAANDGSLLYVGVRITRERGAEEMVRAMGFLPQNVDARLKLIGRLEPSNLAESLSRIPGWERTQYVGPLGRKDLAIALRRAAAGLALLHAEPNYITAQPVKVFEYMCAGLPVIASDLPGCREIIKTARCGLLVNPLEPRDIAQAIAHLWANPDEAKAMGQRGFEAVQERYNWASQEKILLRLYQSLCDFRRDEMVIARSDA